MALNLHYEFETTGVTDSSGNSNTGTLAGTGTTLVAGQIGNALSFNGSGYVTFTSTALLGLASSTSEFTISCWVKTSQLDATLVCLRNSGVPNTLLDFVIGYNGASNVNTGKLSVIIRGDNGAGLVAVNGATAINNNAWHHAVLTRDSSKLLTIYLDGVSNASGTDTLTGGLTPNVAGSALAYERVAATRPLTGAMDDFRFYNTALTSVEVAALYAAGSVTPVVLTAAAGSYTLTGASAGLAGQAVAASGSYTITGTAAALLCKQVAAAGSYTITGATAALKRGHVAGAGSYTLTGSAATLLYKQVAAAGSYTLTGTAATFVATANLVFPAAASSYTLTGSAAAFLTGGNAVLPTDPGAYTLTGMAAGFITVTAITKADISFIGQTVTVRDAQVVPVTQASVLFAGKTITIALVGTEVIPVGKGDILFTGQNIAISTTGEQPPLIGGGGVSVPPWRDLGRKKRRRYRALEEIEKRLDQRIERLTAEARQIGEVVPRQTGELVPGQIDVLSQTVVLGQIDVLSHQDRQAQINQMLHEAQRRAEKVRQERIELDRLARIASEEADDEEAIAMLMRFL